MTMTVFWQAKRFRREAMPETGIGDNTCTGGHEGKPGFRKVFLPALIVLSLLSGCGSQPSLAEMRASAAALGHGDILIGLAWPLASNDSGLSQGVELAVSEINSNGGINGRDLRILPQDDGDSVTKGEAVAQSFAENKNVVAVIGDSSSDVSLPAAAIYDQAGLVMLTPGSTDPELTEQGYTYVFRDIPSDAAIARRLVDYAWQQGHRRMAIYYSNDDYGRGLANAIEDSAEQVGLRIVDRISYYEDLKQLARKWQAFDCDGVFVADSLPDAGQFIAGARQAGIIVPFLGGDALDSSDLIETAGQAANGTVVGSYFNPQSSRPEVAKFKQAYKAKYGGEPSSSSSAGYDAVNLLAEVISKAKSTEPAKIAHQLHALRDWPGVLGSHSFDQTGEERGNLVVLKQVQNGRFVYIKR